MLTLVWGTTWAAIRVGLAGLPPFTAVAIRFAIATTILLAIARASKVELGRQPHEKTLWFVNGLLFFSVSYGVVYWSELYVPSALASILFATFPLLVTLFAHWILPHEPLRAAAGVGAVVAFAGIVVIFSEDLAKIGGPKAAHAAAVLLLSPLVSSLSSVLVKRYGAAIHPISLAAVPMAIAAAVMGALALIFERGQPIAWTPATIGSLAYLSVCGSAVTFTLYYWLLRHVRANRVALIAYLTPVIAVVTGVVALHEHFTVRFLIGGLLVIAGVAVAAKSPPVPIKS
ncbi:MAG TPA: DMT family transporter [Candidatus Polarisedimenticolaceae bacterium]|nr:DMT family transporter [Candidatus Polarisedimenticolaceae bacterium]